MDALQIEKYQHGEIVVNGKRYRHDVVLDGEVSLCWESRTCPGQLPARYVRRLLKGEPEVIIFGMGAGSKLGLTKKAIACLEASGVEWHALPTKKACRLYNRLAATRHVIAVLHLES